MNKINKKLSFIGFVIFILGLISCTPDSINNKHKRNANWAWVTDLNGNNGEWLPIKNNGKTYDCTYQLFYDNGIIRETGKKINDENIDTIYFYDIKGEPTCFQLPNYTPDKIFFYKNGVAKKYYANGKLMTKANVANKRLNGLSTTYFEDGSIWKEIESLNGIQHGQHREYYKNGKIYVVSDWKNGIQHGEYKEYYENGQLKEVTDWFNGKTNGKTLVYYDNGKLKFSCKNSNGQTHGESLVYYSDGKLLARSYYKMGKKDGNVECFYRNGVLYCTGEYLNNLHSGRWSVYTYKGELFRKLVWDKGKRIKMENIKSLSDKETEEWDKIDKLIRTIR